MKFTSGKWNYEEYIPDGVTLNGKEYLISSEGNCEEYIPGGVTPKSKEYLISSGWKEVALAVKEADERLIAAAPEMYELLEMAAQSLRHHSDNDGIIAYRIEQLLIRIDVEEVRE